MKTYSISEVENNVTAGDYWITGYLRLADENQQLYYVTCSNCNATITADVGLKYKSFLCKQQVKDTLKPIVIMKAIDQTSVADVVALNNMAEDILKTTAADMQKLIIQGGKIDLDPIKAEFDGKTFSCLLRRTHSRSSSIQRRLILKAYFHCEPNATKARSSTDNQILDSEQSTNASDLPLSPLKQQLSNFGITSGNSPKKQLNWNESSKSGNRGKDLLNDNDS